MELVLHACIVCFFVGVGFRLKLYVSFPPTIVGMLIPALNCVDVVFVSCVEIRLFSCVPVESALFVGYRVE